MHKTQWDAGYPAPLFWYCDCEILESGTLLDYEIEFFWQDNVAPHVPVLYITGCSARYTRTGPWLAIDYSHLCKLLGVETLEPELRSCVDEYDPTPWDAPVK